MWYARKRSSKHGRQAPHGRQVPQGRKVPQHMLGLAVPLALMLTAAPLQAENLHATWQGEGSSALIDRMLTTLAEDLRSNRLFLSTGTEQLRSFLLQRLCLAASTGCVLPAAANTSDLVLTPAQVDLLLQHLTASMQAQHLPLHQQQLLLQQLALRTPAPAAAQPLASL